MLFIILLFITFYCIDYVHVPNPEQHSTVEDYVTRWSSHFNQAPDLFELQRGLNNCFGYDLVPPVPVIKSAIQAARRLNDFPTAVRVFGALKAKTENDRQYKIYLEALAEDIDQLGICTPEELNRSD